jgi:hypothetical protein
MLLIQLLLNRIMIPLNPIRPRTNRQQIIRNPHAPRHLTRQRPDKKRLPLPNLLKPIRDCREALRTLTTTVFLRTDTVLLLEDELVGFLGADQSPLGRVSVGREGDFLGESVAELERVFGGFVHAAAAFVGFAL